MKILKEFREFAIKGNMIDMAIGIIIGAAFKDVVNVIVEKLFMPFLSLFTNGINLENKKIIIRAQVTQADGTVIPEIALVYGELINVFIDFLIIALVIFILVKFINSLKDRANDPKDSKVTTPKDIELLYELKELMKEQNELLKRTS